MGRERIHFEAEVLAVRLATEREGKSTTLASGDSGSSAGNSTDSVYTDSIDTDSVDSARTLQRNFDLRKKTSALRVRGEVLRRSDLQEV